MRLFVAVNIPEELKDKIAEVQSRLKKVPLDIRWVDNENFHLTLKFLGEVSDQKRESVISAVSKAVKGFGVFSVSFYGLGVFPNINRPRVVWVGVKEGETKLKELAARIDNELLQYDFEKEKRDFSGHLTLGRVRSLKNISDLSKKIPAYEKTDFGSFAAANVDLMQSNLSPKGARYTCIKSMSI